MLSIVAFFVATPMASFCVALAAAKVAMWMSEWEW